jgi:hypothetical protein
VGVMESRLTMAAHTHALILWRTAHSLLTRPESRPEA